MTSRKDTPFEWARPQDETCGNIDEFTLATLVDHIQTFERLYHDSEDDKDIPDRFHFKWLRPQGKRGSKGRLRKWSLYQIYIGLQGKYRAIVMFMPNRESAWWVWVFKKERQNEPTEIEHAETRAQQLWKKLDAQATTKAKGKNRHGYHNG